MRIWLSVRDAITAPDRATQRTSILSSGARCGVYALIAYDRRQKLPPGTHLEDLSTRCLHLAFEDGRFVCRDEVLSEFALTLDEPPAEETSERSSRGALGRLFSWIGNR